MKKKERTPAETGGAQDAKNVLNLKEYKPYVMAHNYAFKFRILEPEKVQFAPQAGKIYKMQKWEGRTFESEDGSHFIRTTPKHVIVYVNVELGAEKVVNLIIKYVELAKTYAFKFSQRYNIKLNSTPELYCSPHFTLTPSVATDNILQRIEINIERTINTIEERQINDISRG